MPAIYAHDRFGKKVYNKLDGNLKRIVSENYEQYRIGLQGPDIFFFYKPLKSNDVAKYGNHLHSISAYDFFENAVNVLRKNEYAENEYAYIMGFICHYILDSECHGYVDEMIKELGVDHLEIEEEFEKMLLKKDGEDPIGYPLKNLIPQDEKTVVSIEPFYDDVIDKDVVRQSLKDMKMVKGALYSKSRFGQWVRNTILKLAGKEEYKWIMHQIKDNPICEKSNTGLYKRFENSVDIAAEMIKSFDDTLKNGEELNKRFDRNFE